MQESPGLFGGNERSGEDDGVEGDVVFAHKLIELDFLALPPGSIVFAQVAGCDGDVADGGIEPNIENFALELFQRDRDSPLQVSGNALGFKPHSKPTVGNSY